MKFKFSKPYFVFQQKQTPCTLANFSEEQQRTH